MANSTQASTNVCSTASGDELLPIAVWITQDEKSKTLEELQTEVASQFPGTREALASTGVVWAVEDHELATQIYRAYADLLKVENTRLVEPIYQWMLRKGGLSTLPTIF